MMLFKDSKDFTKHTMKLLSGYNVKFIRFLTIVDFIYTVWSSIFQLLFTNYKYIRIIKYKYRYSTYDLTLCIAERTEKIVNYAIIYYKLLYKLLSVK